jgi:hypothetical protein
MLNMKKKFDSEVRIVIENFKKKLLLQKLSCALQSRKKIRVRRSFSDPLGYFTSDQPVQERKY